MLSGGALLGLLMVVVVVVVDEGEGGGGGGLGGVGRLIFLQKREGDP